MALESAPTIPKARLAERALRKNTKALRTFEQHTGSEAHNSLPTTESMEDAGEIILTSDERERILAAFERDAEVFNNAVRVKTPKANPSNVNDTRPPWDRTCTAHVNPFQALPDEDIVRGNGTHPQTSLPTTQPTTEEPPQQSTDSNYDSARLVKATSSIGSQLENVFPSHFPLFQHVQNHRELGFYIDRSKYAICVGPGPVEDLQYGIIIVPFGEEQILFKPEQTSKEASFAIQQELLRRHTDRHRLFSNPAAHFVIQDSEHESGEAPLAAQQEPSRHPNGNSKSLSSNSAVPLAAHDFEHKILEESLAARLDPSWRPDGKYQPLSDIPEASLPVRDTLVNPTARSRARGPPKRSPNDRVKSSRITKAAGQRQGKPRPRIASLHPRRSRRLNAA